MITLKKHPTMRAFQIDKGVMIPCEIWGAEEAGVATVMIKELSSERPTVIYIETIKGNDDDEKKDP